jgi:hypothetical protein
MSLWVVAAMRAPRQRRQNHFAHTASSAGFADRFKSAGGWASRGNSRPWTGDGNQEMAALSRLSDQCRPERLTCWLSTDGPLMNVTVTVPDQRSPVRHFKPASAGGSLSGAASGALRGRVARRCDGKQLDLLASTAVPSGGWSDPSGSRRFRASRTRAAPSVKRMAERVRPRVPNGIPSSCSFCEIP